MCGPTTASEVGGRCGGGVTLDARADGNRHHVLLERFVVANAGVEALSDHVDATLLGEHLDADVGVLREERHIGLSNVTAAQIAQGLALTSIVCVQNHYNLVRRQDDAIIDDLDARCIAYVPFFPLGGFTPLQSSALDAVASRLGATPHQVALAWLLRRSPNVLLIPGTSSLAHLRENLASASLVLRPEDLEALNGLADPP